MATELTPNDPAAEPSRFEDRGEVFAAMFQTQQSRWGQGRDADLWGQLLPDEGGK